MPQQGAPRLLHERIAAGRAAVIARLALALEPGTGLPDPELSAHMLSAYADEAARLVLQDYDVERILELTRWTLNGSADRELRGGAVDHRGLLAEGEAQVRARGVPGRVLKTAVGIATTPARCGSSRANAVASVPTSALAKYVPCGVQHRQAGLLEPRAEVVALGLELLGEGGVPAVVHPQRGGARRAGTASRRRRSGTAWPCGRRRRAAPARSPSRPSSP